MSYDRKAPKPLTTGTELGLTMAAGTVTPGGAYVMSDTIRDTLYLAALTSDRVGRFTRPMGTGEKQARRDDGFGDGWDSKQRAAAAKLGALWKAALPALEKPGGYATGGKGGDGNLSPEQEEAAREAWAGYSAAMAEVENGCSMRHANALRTVIIHQDASPSSRAAFVREALAHLGAWWKLR